ncbi:NAD(P)H-dependent glycerol-3-phosphate dehydrogenase [Pontivivens insulae]|uniref:Glycerol-3-phosphate dehydrogenase [NAD(P)+] n=1 Tax=Pontivivens insulae TaxID=1639689 RepID=A0A2R8AC82_9RHOB|nr:NAD(P)H-dependent glycerol-3-phosphate dehydrogenase [Pontivivens insulae]RED11023.1 glycerol-3-phosphate dehydrogenase (NAD(P)+) [Pontivivens insulae]SPF29802.1 Glycerol-3-phosphate dehydrogenase [NAD(P)+] [Pontivivens insulae]
MSNTIQRAEQLSYEEIAVIGAGAWGTALAAVARRAGCSVRLFSRDAATAEAIVNGRQNPRYLPGITLPEGLMATTSLEQALDGAEAVLIVTPSGTIRTVSRDVAQFAPEGAPLFACAKGIEAQTGLLMTGIIAEEAPNRVLGCVSGPTFATETAAQQPTAVTIACTSSSAGPVPPHKLAAARMAASLTTDSFRPYVSDDLIGVEIGGAVKNVIAIACGILDGAQFGENARAALITRGLNEIKELAVVLGGRRETVTGLSGIGDLMLTCSSTKSRNFSYGRQRGQGISEADVFDGKPVVVEGRENAITITDLARRYRLHMPICEMVRAIVEGQQPIGEAFAAFWAAPIEAEPRAMQISITHPAETAAQEKFEELLP